MSPYDKFPIVVLLSIAPVLAQAEWRCDCTTIVASCQAQVSVHGEFVDVASDHPSCSRVDYFIDGHPFVAMVVGGKGRQDWLARSADPQVLVQSCQVCRDNAEAAASANEAAGVADAGAKLTPLIKVSPVYPDAAKASGADGYVDVAFTVTPDGTVADAHVTGAEPKGVFDAAALAAVRRWRYPEDPERGPQTLTERVDFRFADYVFGLPVGSSPTAASRAASRPLNQCVREGVSYDYVEMVEVGLISACQEPLLVFSCAAGTRASAGRWSCATSDGARTLLVRPGDPRGDSLAMIERGVSTESYEYRDSFYLDRAPNSQYWWIACAADDDTCSARARQWVRSLDGQLSTVDPRGRSSLELARSS